ncbi:MAG TPA: hypothetical protein QGG47_13775 [Acidobacteriota bacterium]|nr:hypothetical protein [Acidobacteriota bacterium]
MTCLAALAPEGARVTLVGGAIRDALLGRAPNDLDLVVEQGFGRYLDAIERARGTRPADIGDAFQHTHRFRWKGIQVDVARCQGSLVQDLGRRDFSVNALALPLNPGSDLENALVDPFGGLKDLLAGRLREASPGVIAADPLRALRAVRYATDLGGFRIEEATEATVSSVAQQLVGVARERTQAEWSLNLASADWCDALRLGRKLGVCEPTLGRLDSHVAVDAWAVTEAELCLDPPQRRGRLGALILDLAVEVGVDAVIARLLDGRWAPAQVRSAARVARWAGACVGASPERLAAWSLRDPGAAGDAAALAMALKPSCHAAELRRAAQRAGEPRWVTGDDLISWGMSTGPLLGRVLRELALGQINRRWEGPQSARAWARSQARRNTGQGEGC